MVNFLTLPRGMLHVGKRNVMGKERDYIDVRMLLTENV